MRGGTAEPISYPSHPRPGEEKVSHSRERDTRRHVWSDVAVSATRGIYPTKPDSPASTRRESGVAPDRDKRKAGRDRRGKLYWSLDGPRARHGKMDLGLVSRARLNRHAAIYPHHNTTDSMRLLTERNHFTDAFTASDRLYRSQITSDRSGYRTFADTRSSLGIYACRMLEVVWESFRTRVIIDNK